MGKIIDGSDSADNDSVSGGDGADMLIQADWAGADSETIDGGTGVDTVDYRWLDIYYVYITQYVEVDLAAGTVKQYYDDFFGNVLTGTDVLRNVETVIGSVNGDLLNGSAKGENLSGSYGADTLNGGGGNDKLSGEQDDDVIIQKDLNGYDTIDGGSGIDTLDYSQITANLGYVTVDWGRHKVSKYSPAHVLLGVDVFSNIETINVAAPGALPIAEAANADIVGATNDSELIAVGIPGEPLPALIA